jgi:hypothetical protein
VFLERTKEVKGIHDNKTPSKQVKHIVVQETMNEDEFVKVNNCKSLKKDQQKKNCSTTR